MLHQRAYSYWINAGFLLVFSRLAMADVSSNSLSSTILASQTQVVCGDILHLGLAMENQGTEPIKLIGLPNDQIDTAEWYLKPINTSERTRVRSLYHHFGCGPMSSQLFRPGERFLMGNLFVVDGRKPEWQSGKYQILCVLTGVPDKREITSKFDLIVDVPHGSLAKDAQTAAKLSTYLLGGNRSVPILEMLGTEFKPTPSQQEVIAWALMKEAIQTRDREAVRTTLLRFRSACLKMHVLPRQQFLSTIAIMLADHKLGFCDEARQLEPYLRVDYYERGGVLQAINERCR